MTVRIALLAALLAITMGGPAGAATVPVASLSGDFAATNPSVAHHSDGVQFGPYANGGTAGGSLYYSGFNGQTLGAITALSYTVTHNSTDDSPLAAPYLRVYLDGDTHDVIFDPTACATATPTENVAVTYDVVAGEVRYDDDSCDGIPPDQQPWADVVAAHGSEVVSGIYVTQGFSGGLDASANLADLTVNANTFCFHCPPTPDPIPVPVQPTPVVPVVKCQGDEIRTLRAPLRLGKRPTKVRATLRGKTLKVQGRKITVDLRSRPEGNYNVKVTSRYRKRNGKVRTVRTQRNLSVVCA